MKAGLEKIVGTLDEKLMPAKEYVKKKLQEVESGDYRAEELSEVVSRDEVDPDSLLPRWDSKGNLMVMRGSTKAKEHTEGGSQEDESRRLAWRDPTTKDRHFTTPLALFAKRPSGVQPPGQGEYGEAKEQRFEAKGGKDKGRGKGKQPERSSWCCTSSRERRERIRWFGLSGSLQRSFAMCWE
jgi:hypothetical protein